MKTVLLIGLFITTLFATPISYSKMQTCLIRHLDLYKHPSWVAIALTRQNKTAYFSSPKSMLEYYFNPIKWTGLGALNSDDITEVYVTDFNTLEKIDAKKAFYLYGSSVIGPAGDDLIPFSTKAAAKAFMRKYNGSKILKFSELKMSLVNLINGRA